MTPFGVTGKEAERLLDDIGITVNKNAIPFDPLPPNTASGIRVGSPAVTTRGFGPVEMERVGTLIVRALRGRDDSSLMAELAREVHDICARFPAPGLPAGVNLDFEDVPFIVAAFIAAGAAAFFLTPLAMRFAARSGAIDEPDEGRRVHVLPVPRAGGLAVAVAFVGVSIAALLVNDRLGIIIDSEQTARSELVDFRALSALLGGAALAAAFGFIDDRWQVRARWQFILQLVLAGLAIALGVTITFVNNPLDFLGGVFSPSTIVFGGYVAAGITALWIVGMINSINFIDGLDGLSTGVSLIAAITLGIISLTVGQYQPMVALLCAILAGSLAGFLPWNFHPAKVFIGTTGVFVAGYALAILVDPREREDRGRPARPWRADHRYVLDHHAPARRTELALHARSRSYPPSAPGPGTHPPRRGAPHLRDLHAPCAREPPAHRLGPPLRLHGHRHRVRPRAVPHHASGRRRRSARGELLPGR